MSTMGMEYQALKRGATQWRSLAKLMDSTATDLGGVSSAGLPPRLQPAAQGFLTRWEDLVRESSAIAEGFAGALTATQNDALHAEDATDRRFSELDGRLGPER